MLPKGHLLLGLFFTAIIYFAYSISLFHASLIFFSSFLMDFDHYLWWLKRYKILSLRKAYFGNKKLLNNQDKPIMHIFHTIESHIFIVLLSFFLGVFFFILLGMLFHSITDFFTINPKTREYFLVRYLISDKRNYL